MNLTGVDKVLVDMKHKSGTLITFEGIDGCGKTTQFKLAEKWLNRQGFDIACFREPGSTKVAERIRKILLDSRLTMDDTTELLLYEAARADLVAKEMRPALNAGKIVLSDRFYDSTTAYQGYGRKLNLKQIMQLHRVAVGDVHPALTLVFDVPLKVAFARRGKKLDRLESQSKAFFTRVRKGFLDLAERYPRRVRVIDGTKSPEEIFEAVKIQLARRLRHR